MERAACQRVCSWTVEHLAIDREARPMARTVPRLLGGVPSNDATKMRAHARDGMEAASVIAMNRETLTVDANCLSLTLADLAQRLRLRRSKSIAEEMQRYKIAIEFCPLSRRPRKDGVIIVM